MLYSWTLIIAGGLAAVYFLPGLESIGPWLAATGYIIAFGVTMAWRFESGRWRSIRLLDNERRQAAQVAPLGPAPPATDPEASVRDLAEEFQGISEPEEQPQLPLITTTKTRSP
jgi:hypothetical protein